MRTPDGTRLPARRRSRREGVSDAELRAPRRRPRCAAWSPARSSGPKSCCDAGRAAGAPAVGLGEVRRGRLRRRRAGHRCRTARGRLRRTGPHDQAGQAAHTALATPRGVMAGAMNVDAAYAECERITREQARNFAWGIRLLPAPKRRALSAVYAIARRIDDIGDGTLPSREAAAARRRPQAAQRHPTRPRRSRPGRAGRCRASAADPAGRVRRTRRRLRDGRAGPPLRDARRTGRVLPLRRRLDRAAVAGGVRAGARRDDRGPRARSRRRARRRAAADEHPARHPRGSRQRTGRTCPREIWPCSAVELSVPAPTAPSTRRTVRWPSSIRFEAARAWGWYDRGLQLLPLLDRRSAACCAAMAGIYHELLMRIAAEPAARDSAGGSLPTARQAAGCRRRADQAGAPSWLTPRWSSAAAWPVSPPRCGSADAGRAVTLLERRPRLGGAAFSFRRGELTIDNGQHVFLRCCTAYRELSNGSAPATWSPCRTGWTSRCSRPAGGRRTCAGRAAFRRRCTSPPHWPGTRCSPAGSRSGRPAAPSRCAASTRTTAASTR